MKMLLILIFGIISGCNFITMLSGEKSKVKGDPFRIGQEYDNNYLNVEFPSYTRDFYLLEDGEHRTISLSTNADELRCSSDGGANWIECQDSIIWETADITALHIVEATFADGSTIRKEFTPNDDASGITFGSCDETVTADEDISAFNGRVTTANKVICINDGVTISNSGSNGSITPSAGDIVIYARDDDTVLFTNQNEASTPVFSIGPGYPINLYGINITNSTVGGNGINISANTKIMDCNIEITDPSTSSYGVYTFSQSINIEIKNSTVTQSYLDAGSAIYLGASNMTITDSTIKGGYQGIFFWLNVGSTYTLNIENSLIYGQNTNNASSTDPGGIELYANNAGGTLNLNVTNSTLVSKGGPMIVVDDGPGLANIVFSEVGIERTGDSNIDSAMLYIPNSSTITNIDFSAEDSICNHTDNAGSKFTDIVDDAGGIAVFDVTEMDAHSSNTDIGLCEGV